MLISYGPERLAFETLWTRQRYDLLTDFLAGVPVDWRFFLKHRVFEAVERQAPDPRPVADEMAALFAGLKIRYGL
ncbi:MAG: hypothetical protein P4M00_16975 [Azospirillaceae bacterium]|nr:hypothetical protein [Azospirillaceae bacterium]